MAHDVFIVLHALAGLVAFGCGVRALRHPAWFESYWWSLLAMAAFVGAAVAVSWTELDTASRLIFLGLGALAGLMIWRATVARRLLRAGDYPSPAATGHVGFTLVGLFDAFVVVGLLDLGAPGWLTVVVALVVAVAGHLLIVRARRTRPTPIA